MPNPDFDSTRPLTDDEISKISEAKRKAFVLYEGVQTPHRSCGVCLAETFNVNWKPYQALRKGGITGEGHCGAIRAGEMILGEILGPETPEGGVSPMFKNAIVFYQDRWREKEKAAGWKDTICNTLTAPLGDFSGETRKCFCTNMAADAAEIVAEALIRANVEFKVEEIV